MVFSDTSTKLGIIQACEQRCSITDAGISGNTQLLKEFTARVNKWNRKVWHMIFTSYGGWQYDDANQTDLPFASATLTADQTTYALPSSSLTVRGIEIKDEGDVWYPLTPLTEERIREYEAMGEFQKTSSRPLYYQLVGQTVRVFPASNYTQSASFKVSFDRGSVAFASTDTTTAPGFAGEYHDILPLGASLDYLTEKRPNDSTTALIRAEIQEYEAKIKQFYTMKFSQMFPPRIRVRDVLRDYV